LNNKIAYTILSLYILLLSLTPLLGGLIASRGWIGFDTGAYYYRSERLEVRFTGLPEGMGKPRVYVYMPNSSYRPILLLDVDDRESTVEGFSFFYEARDVKTKTLNNTLLVDYVFDDFNVTKYVVAFNESIVLGFRSKNELVFRIVFKGKNYTHINQVSLRELEGKSVEFNDISRLNFTFYNRLTGIGGGSLEFSRAVKVSVIEDLEGVTTIAVEFRGDHVEVVIRGYVEPVRVSPVVHTVSSALNHRFVQLLLPVVALIAVSLGWIVWRKL
jgi:hypothetical protein